MSIPISAIVITKNEEINLPRCLDSLAWADEILVVDSFSNDGTMEIAQRTATRVLQHPFYNFASQRNFAQIQAKYDWVLFIDADEQVSPEMAHAIQTLAHTDELARFNGYYLHRVQLFSGRWWPDPAKAIMPAEQLAREHVSEGTVRLFDRRLGQWTRMLHEIVQIPPPCGVVNGVLYHYSTSNLSLTCDPFNAYTDLEAVHLHTAGQRTTLLGAVFRGVRSFIFHFFFNGLWRYGQHGFLMAIINGYTKFMNYAKLWERIRIQNEQGIWTDQDKKLLERFLVKEDYLAEKKEKI